MFEKIQKLNDARRVWEEKIQKEGRELLSQAFQQFFEAHPEIEAFRWRQYTPYFNDGDTCYFGFYGFDYKLREAPKDAVTVGTASDTKPRCVRRSCGIELENAGVLFCPDCGQRQPDAEDRDDVEDDMDWQDSWDLQVPAWANPNLKEDIKGLEDAVESLGEGAQLIFGDHVRVLVTRKGITTDHYEHD
jgi:hypothetical protein